VRGVVHSEFVPSGQTVNQAFYLEVLKRLRNSLRQKRPDLWQAGEWFFHHDNAPVHTTLSIRWFLTKNGMTTVFHPPYSPDLASCNFFLFPRMKRDMNGKRFVVIDEVKKKRRRRWQASQKMSLKNASKIGTKDWTSATESTLKEIKYFLKQNLINNLVQK